MSEHKFRVEGLDRERLNSILGQVANGESARRRMVNEIGTREFGLVPGGFELVEGDSGHLFIVPSNPEALEEEEAEVVSAFGERVGEALLEEGFETLESLEGLTDAELGAISGIGPASVEDIREQVPAPVEPEEETEEEGSEEEPEEEVSEEESEEE